MPKNLFFASLRNPLPRSCDPMGIFAMQKINNNINDK